MDCVHDGYSDQPSNRLYAYKIYFGSLPKGGIYDCFVITVVYFGDISQMNG